ncbi:MAG: serpin family protein [Staphylothermus sp.]|nr:serpin family protein [Staphylothermus sp.]
MNYSRSLYLSIVSIVLIIGVSLGVFYYVFYRGSVSEIVYGKPVDSYTVFSLELLKRSGLGRDNTAVSPLSIYIALLMLTEGAGSDTRTELMSALYLSSLSDARDWFKDVLSDVLNVSDPARSSVANSIWVQEGFPINKSYVELLEEYYYAEEKYVDFIHNPPLAVKMINDWVSNKTYGLIERIVDESSIDPQTRIVLINTLYFKANWTTPFTSVLLGKFHSPKGDIDTDYLVGEQDVWLIETNDYIAIALGYLGTDIKFVVIMPKNGDLEGFVSSLDRQELLGIFDKLFSEEPVRIELHLPAFDIDSGIISYRDKLKDMGIVKAFDPNQADFGPMHANNSKVLYVSDVLHRARVKITIYGTEAAAATAIVMKLESVPEVYKEVWINKPFLFFLVDPENNAVFFAGSYLYPPQQ